MNESSPNTETVDFGGSVPTRESVRKKFQEDWELASVGGPEPEPERYAAALAEPDRSARQSELLTLATEFRRRRSGAACRLIRTS